MLALLSGFNWCVRKAETLSNAYQACTKANIKAAFRTIPTVLRAIKSAMPSRREAVVGAVAMTHGAVAGTLITEGVMPKLWQATAYIVSLLVLTRFSRMPRRQVVKAYMENFSTPFALSLGRGVGQACVAARVVPRLCNGYMQWSVSARNERPEVALIEDIATAINPNILEERQKRLQAFCGAVEAANAYPNSMASNGTQITFAFAMIAFYYGWLYIINECAGIENLPKLDLILPIMGCLGGAAVGGPAGAVIGGFGTRVAVQILKNIASNPALRQRIRRAFRYFQELGRPLLRRECRALLQDRLNAFDHPRQHCAEDSPLGLIVAYAGAPLEGRLNPEQPMRSAN